MIARFLIACAALSLASAAAAQRPEQRRLEVPATASWKHALTDMILPSRPVGFARSVIADNTEEELDIIAQYEAEDATATVYLYRTGIPDAALWFDRATATMTRSPRWGVKGPIVPETFARPGATAESGLLAAVPASGEAWRSTGVAIAPLGDWLVKMRMSSETLDAAALEERMRALLGALRWPASAGEETTAKPVEPCAEPLKFKRAKLVKQEAADVLMNLFTAGVVEEKKSEAPPPTYCREPVDLGAHGVYRPDASRNSYVIALNDAGIGLSLAPALTIEGLGGGGKGWSMMLLERNSRSAMPSFNRLPPPDQALAVAMGGGPRISATAGKPKADE